MGMPNLISRRLGAWPDGHPCQDQGRAPQTQRQELSSQDWNLQTGYPRLEPAIFPAWNNEPSPPRTSYPWLSYENRLFLHYTSIYLYLYIKILYLDVVTH